jgi:hypothetical protein
MRFIDMISVESPEELIEYINESQHKSTMRDIKKAVKALCKMEAGKKTALKKAKKSKRLKSTKAELHLYNIDSVIRGVDPDKISSKGAGK